jgi:putative transposase
LRLRKSKRLGGSTDQNVIEDFVQVKLAEAKKNRKTATELAHALRTLATAPTVRTPPGPPKVPSASPQASAAEIGKPADAATSSQPARPNTLRIGTGHAF